MILMYVSVNHLATAERIAEAILRERMANHINLLPDNASLVWENGQVKRSAEHVLLIKTKALLYSNIEKLVKDMGLDERPKMFSVPITQIDFDYHDFLKAEVLKV